MNCQNTATPGRTIVMNQGARVTTPSGNQKIVFLTQRPQTPANQGHVSQPASQAQQQNTVVKFVSNANTGNTQKMVTTQQKLVVVCMPGSNSTTTVSSSGVGQNMSQVNQMGKQSFIPQPKRDSIEDLTDQ